MKKVIVLFSAIVVVVISLGFVTRSKTNNETTKAISESKTSSSQQLGSSVINEAQF